MSWSERQALTRFGEVVPILTSRLLYWMLYIVLLISAAASSLFMYRFGLGPTLLLSALMTAIVPPWAQFMYERDIRFRFGHLLRDETLSAIMTSAQNRTGILLAHEMWLRKSSTFFVIPVTTLSGNAVVVSRKALELLKADPEKAEVVLADRLFRLKASNARRRFVLTTLVWGGAYLAATLTVSWLGLGYLMYVSTAFLLSMGLPLFALAAILGLLLVRPLFWSDNPGKASMKEIYGVSAVVAESEVASGRTLTPDEVNAVSAGARRDEMSRRAERRSIVSLLSAGLAILPSQWSVYFFPLSYYMYLFSTVLLIGIPVGVLFVVMIVVYLWDRRCIRQSWGFVSETQEPMWMD